MTDKTTKKKKIIVDDDDDDDENTDLLKCTNNMIESLAKLNLLDDAVLSELITASPKQYGQLFLSMGHFLSKSCGNINKIYEMALSLEFCDVYDKEKYTITHVKNEYGADIIITEKESGIIIGVEVKSSAVTKKNNFKTNWIFSLNSNACQLYHDEKDSTEQAKQRKVLIDSLYKKMSNGFVVLQAMHGNTKIAEYKLSGLFMAFFCVTKILVNDKSSINLGCHRCKNCGEYHRITILMKYEKLFTERMTQKSNGLYVSDFEYFNDTEFCALFNESCPANCKKED